MDDTKDLFKKIHDNAFHIKISQKSGAINALDDLKKEVFVEKQNFTIIRKWFNSLPEIKLTDKELEIVKKHAVKPKKTKWEFIFKILLYQNHLSFDDQKKWFSYINEDDIKLVAIKIIDDKRIDDDKLKLYLYKELLKMPKYFGQTLSLMNTAFKMGDRGFWEDCFEVVVDMVNKNDKISDEILTVWKHLTYLDEYAEKKKITSLVLFKETKKDHYLPQEVHDVFLF